MSRPSISLCLIAKDEESTLAGCLASAEEAVDEIVVVDTGSCDGTIEIARSFGARIEQREWEDDFSKARNAALALAQGDFILVLDADERLVESARLALRRLVDADREDAPPTIYLPFILNVDRRGRSLGGGFMARLWRRRPELSFSGRIHERVGAGVANLVLRHEQAFQILHFGYDPEVSAARGKRTRNRMLLERALAERPDDPILRYHLAQELYAAADFRGALETFRAIIEEGTIINYVLTSYVFATECVRILGDAEDALALALEGLRRAEDYGELWYAAGRAALSAGRAAEAAAYFENSHREPRGPAAGAFRDPAIRSRKRTSTKSFVFPAWG